MGASVQWSCRRKAMDLPLLRGVAIAPIRSSSYLKTIIVAAPLEPLEPSTIPFCAVSSLAIFTYLASSCLPSSSAPTVTHFVLLNHHTRLFANTRARTYYILAKLTIISPTSQCISPRVSSCVPRSSPRLSLRRPSASPRLQQVAPSVSPLLSYGLVVMVFQPLTLT